MSERGLDRRLAGTEGVGRPDTASWLDSMRWTPDLPDEMDGQPLCDQAPTAVSFRIDSNMVQQAMRALADGFRTSARSSPPG